MPPCPQLAYTIDTTTPVPGATSSHIQNNFGSDLNTAKDTLYVAAVDGSSNVRLALVDFPSMTITGLHPGPIVLNRPFPFAVGPDGSVYNLWLPGAGNCSLSKWSPAGVELYRVLQSGTDTALVYNPTNDLLYGWSDFGLFYWWDPATGLSTTAAFGFGFGGQDVNTRPVVTADGTVWVLNAAKTHVGRFHPGVETWDVFPLGFTAIDLLWHGPDANTVAVIDDTAVATHKVDTAGTVTTICIDLPPSDTLASTVVSDDFSIVLLEGTGNIATSDPVHYYRWAGAARARVGRVYT